GGGAGGLVRPSLGFAGATRAAGPRGPARLVARGGLAGRRDPRAAAGRSRAPAGRHPHRAVEPVRSGIGRQGGVAEVDDGGPRTAGGPSARRAGARVPRRGARLTRSRAADWTVGGSLRYTACV